MLSTATLVETNLGMSWRYATILIKPCSGRFRIISVIANNMNVWKIKYTPVCGFICCELYKPKKYKIGTNTIRLLPMDNMINIIVKYNTILIVEYFLVTVPRKKTNGKMGRKSKVRSIAETLWITYEGRLIRFSW